MSSQLPASRWFLMVSKDLLELQNVAPILSALFPRWSKRLLPRARPPERHLPRRRQASSRPTKKLCILLLHVSIEAGSNSVAPLTSVPKVAVKVARSSKRGVPKTATQGSTQKRKTTNAAPLKKKELRQDSLTKAVEGVSRTTSKRQADHSYLPACTD
jgi:hypothetical protein